nr:aldehyde dehydrogenase family protein [Euzebya tangerina]
MSIGPLVDILAAGNRAIVKPSEHAPASAELVEEMIGESFRETVVAVVTGGVDLAQQFASMPWDHLLFTGGGAIGRRVLQAARCRSGVLVPAAWAITTATTGSGTSPRHGRSSRSHG